MAPAATLDPAALADLFNRSYAGYFMPVALAPEALAAMNAAHDVDLARSRVAIVDGAPAGIVLLAARGRRGWIGGMGVTAEHRGRGLGRELMLAALEAAAEASLVSVQLEVIEENRWAIEVYRNTGFRDLRALEVWARPAGPLPEARPGPAAVPLDPSRWIATLPGRPVPDRPWQREPVTLERAADLEVFAVLAGGEPAAGVALRASGPRGTILDVGAAPGAPPASLRAALAAALAAHPGTAFTMLNLDANDPASAAFAELGFEARFRQREMRWGAAAPGGSATPR